MWEVETLGYKTVNQTPIISNIGSKESNQKHKQIPITSQYIKVIMLSNMRNKEKEI